MTGRLPSAQLRDGARVSFCPEPVARWIYRNPGDPAPGARGTIVKAPDYLVGPMIVFVRWGNDKDAVGVFGQDLCADRNNGGTHMTGLGSYAVKVIADDSGKWVGNQLRFRTKKEAENYGQDLFMRWMSVREKRVVRSKDPVNTVLEPSGERRHVAGIGGSVTRAWLGIIALAGVGGLAFWFVRRAKAQAPGTRFYVVAQNPTTGAWEPATKSVSDLEEANRDAERASALLETMGRPAMLVKVEARTPDTQVWLVMGRSNAAPDLGAFLAVAHVDKSTAERVVADMRPALPDYTWWIEQDWFPREYLTGVVVQPGQML
jgi:hypothetical protein